MKAKGRCSWVYVLSSESKVYVGMTVRLATRIREHVYTKRTKSTSSMHKWKLLAVYKYCRSERHNHATEKRITLEMMKLKGWHCVRGAGFCRGLDKDRKAPKELSTMGDPLVCGCGVPVGHDHSKQGRRYTYCPRSRMGWLQKVLGGDVEVCLKGCGFF